MEWLVAQGVHPRVSVTTVRVARDLAERMDYDTGHVRYCVEGMVGRLGLSRATVARHVGYLRELGALAWVVRGSRANVRRARGLGGYAATATVYAAVIPPVYDRALGHVVVGSGYTARIVVDHRRVPADPAAAARRVLPSPRSAPAAGAADSAGNPVDNSPVETSCSQGVETPSLTLVKEAEKVEVVGGCNYTPRQGACRRSEIPHQSSPVNGRRRTAGDVRRAARTVRLVRSLVNWTQTVPLRRLEFVLRPLTDRGLDACEIAAELTGMCAGVRWRPERPDQFIRARLAADASPQRTTPAASERTTALEHAAAAMRNPAWAAWVAEKRAKEAAEVPVLPGPVREILTALVEIAPQVVPVAERAADVLYSEPAGTDDPDISGRQRRRQLAAASAAWQNVTARYADELAAHHARKSTE
ncbi:cell wall protein [Streptomyces flavofungini]|uniref:cell wall protein n=1 Tax=Streptomyces flavofungini TaxID=68200 RepID=UPI0025AF5B57|nr:cell wall protein [Streptomyces flavofungini]WJV51764.1 cell wall protein [Streptomyces flavofungini]